MSSEIFIKTRRAEGAIFNFAGAVVDENVGAFGDELVVEEAAVHSGFVPTFADGFELFDVVGDLEEASGAFETAVFLAEVEAETIGHDGDVKLDGDLHELVGLVFGEELSFVD